MTRDPDDDALSWAGDDDPTLSTTPTAAEGSLAPGWSTVGEPGTVIESHEQGSAGEQTGNEASENSNPDAAAASSAALIVLGVLGGVYLLYTIGWAISASRIINPAPDLVGAFMFSAGLWLAAAAPVLWFALTLWLTRAASRWRYVWLLLGVLVLAPLPFIAGVGVTA